MRGGILGNYSGSANTICPYYDRETKLSITCQGIIDNTYVRNQFASKEAKNEWQENLCETYEYSRCIIADCNNKKYDDLGQAIVKQVTLIKVKSKKSKSKKVKTRKVEIEKDNQLAGQMSLQDFLKRG